VTRRLFRLLILLAVALAVPLQGAAAVSVGQCMALGHHDMADGHSQAHSGADHGASGHHHGDHEKTHGGAHCGPCVACCASVSIAGSVTLFSPAAPARAAETVPLQFLAGVLPDELDRPPLAL